MEDQEQYAVIRIKDCGPGIPEEDFLYAKQKFYRGRNALNQQGAGLGLYLSELLMRQMEGKLELENREGPVSYTHLPQELRCFLAVFFRIKFKVNIMKKSCDAPVVFFLSEA